MTSTTNEIRNRTDSLDENPIFEEQQGLLQPGLPTAIPPPATMGSDAIKPEGRKGDGAANIIVWVFVVTSWAIVFSSDPGSLGWFKYHPLLQTLAIACFTYGILTLQPTSQPKTKAAGLQRHKIAMIGLGVPLILAGTAAIILQKNSHLSPHFTSWHGTFGIITVAWIVIQALFGGTTVWFEGALWGGGMRPKLMWKYHRLSGYILFPLLLTTAHLGGGWSMWVSINSPWVVQLLAYTVAPIFILTGVYLRIRPSKMKFF
ncbi:hypothetical protein JVU11DRAFT_321 [Chiua virens]|nr:hypothetical protein JVU11DRAFT_321 [Chiua virens]